MAKPRMTQVGARRMAVQAVLLVVAAVLAIWFVRNLAANLSAAGLRLDFGFLSGTASFELGESAGWFESGDSLLRAYFAGMVNTLRVSLLAIMLASLLGLMIGIARLSSHRLLSRAAFVYVETVRNTPLLLQILFWYTLFTHGLPPAREAIRVFGCALLTNRGFFFPSLEPLGWVIAGTTVVMCAGLVWWSWRPARWFSRWIAAAVALSLPMAIPAAVAAATRASVVTCPALAGFNIVGGGFISPEFIAVVLALSIYGAAFISEIVRGSILGVPRGQFEAARAVGLSAMQVLRFVIVPQAMRSMVPPMTNQYLNILKSSSLGVAVGYPELIRVSIATTNQTGHAIECVVIVMSVYLTISLAIAGAMNAYNRRQLAKVGR